MLRIQACLFFKYLLNKNFSLEQKNDFWKICFKIFVEKKMNKKLSAKFYKIFVVQANFNFAGDWAPMCPSPWKPVVDVWADTPILPKDPRFVLLLTLFMLIIILFLLLKVLLTMLFSLLLLILLFLICFFAVIKFLLLYLLVRLHNYSLQLMMLLKLLLVLHNYASLMLLMMMTILILKDGPVDDIVVVY